MPPLRACVLFCMRTILMNLGLLLLFILQIQLGWCIIMKTFPLKKEESSCNNLEAF